MEAGLVSIITPCYNGEKFVKRYFEAILNQTYKNMELFFINDGSTDRTEKIALKYKEIFEEQGISFTYIYQENAGQAVAINKALKLFNGEFLTWPDSDDLLYRDSIEKRVMFLNKNKQFTLVRNAVNIIDEDTKKQIGKFSLRFPKSHIFKNLITGKKVFYSPISYMVRSIDFIKTNPKREIFVTRYGQNWQMLLPISYKGKCGYIPKPLCEYYVRQNSHSRIKSKDIEDEFYKINKHEEILENVLSEMGIYTKYEKFVKCKFLKQKFVVAYLYNNYGYASKILDELKKEGKANIRDRIKCLSLKNENVKKILERIKKIRRK